MNSRWKRILAIASVSALAAATNVWAVDYTWNNDNQSWSVEGNWLPSSGGPPGASDTGIIGGGASSIRAFHNANLSGPPDEIIVRTNGVLRIGTASMTTEHNIVMDGGWLSAYQNRSSSSTISMKSDSIFQSAGGNLGLSGTIQDYGGDAGMVIVSNTSGSFSFSHANNTYSGGTQVRRGKLNISGNDSTGTGDVELWPLGELGHQGVTLSSGRILLLGGQISAVANYSLNAETLVKTNSSIKSTASGASLSGLIRDFDASNTGRIRKLGSGNYSINRAGSPFTGGFDVEEGTLTAAAFAALGQGSVIVTNGAGLRCLGTTGAASNSSVTVLSGGSVTLYSSSSTNITVKDGGSIYGYTANRSTSDDIRIEGDVKLYRDTSGYMVWSGVFSDGDVPGRLVLSGTGTAPTRFRGVNTFSGGLEITDGGPGAAAFEIDDTPARLPDTGEIMIHTNGILEYNVSIADTVGSLTGVGIVRLGGSTITAAEGVAPGTNDTMAGALTVDENGSLVLGSSSTNTFGLDALASPGDMVVMPNASGNLTLDGTLEVSDLGGLEPGDYTLFDLNGGTIGGAFTATNMPPKLLGSIDTSSGDVVLTVTLAPLAGTVITIR